MKKRTSNKQVTNIYFNTSNHSSKSHKPKRDDGNGGSRHHNSYNGGNRHRSNNGNRHDNHRPSDRVAMATVIASAAVSIVRILKQKNELDYLR